MKYTINAKGKKLGRVASEAAALLMGKSSSSFMRNRVADVEVEIVNASLLSLSTKKKKEKKYTRYTGYPSGLREETLGKVITKHGATEPIRRAVYGMLPANRLRKERMKKLKIFE